MKTENQRRYDSLSDDFKESATRPAVEPPPGPRNPLLTMTPERAAKVEALGFVPMAPQWKRGRLCRWSETKQYATGATMTTYHSDEDVLRILEIRERKG